MGLKVMRICMVLIGASLGSVLGYALSYSVASVLNISLLTAMIGTSALGAVIFGIIGFIISKPLLKLGMRLTEGLEGKLSKIPFSELVGGTVGLILALLVASLVSMPISELPVIGPYLPILLYIVFGYLGISLGRKWREKFEKLAENGAFSKANRQSRKEILELKKEAEKSAKVHPKVLDTSVIIDGRIVDICKTGFLEGPLVVTNFVLDELRHIADSADHLKRVRGRRGLDMLNELQTIGIEVIIDDSDYEQIEEVDAKLVQLAKDLGGYVVTNDFNLNKVATFQNIKVLNVNELAGAIKTVVLPGESMTVEIVAQGKEADQGVGYLDDGTMIVVEKGREAIGQTVETIVTSVIQTNAGRMIFVKMV